MKKLSTKIENMKESPLLEFDRKIKESLNENKYPWDKAIFMNIGQPDFPTPDVIKNSMRNELEKNGNNFYIPVTGLDILKKRIAAYLKKTHGIDYDPNMIVITNGAKEALWLALCALVENNDEIIIIAPYWPTYIEDVVLVDGKPVVVNSRDDFHLDLAAIESAITERTKAVMINTPNNPSGIVYARNELEKLAEIAEKYDVYLISDEVYGTLVYGAEFCSMGGIEKVRERTIVANGFSKSDSVTGFRMGYLIAPNKKIAGAIQSIKSNTTGNTCSFMQYAFASAIENIKELTDSEEKMRVDFEKRGLILNKGLREAGMEVNPIKGAFYIFAKMPLEFSDLTSVKFSHLLFRKTGIVVSPGELFGEKYKHWIRFSFASSMEDIKETVKRIKEFLKTG